MLLNDIFTEAADATYFKDQVRGTEKAKTVKSQPHKGSQPHPFQGRLVGGESVDSNPTDKVTMDIPLFLRMMEYAKEDAKTDMDLHDVTERAIALMKEHEYLCMDNYNDLVGGEATGGAQPTNEEKKGLYYYVNKRKKAGTSRPKSHPKAPSAQDWKNAAKTAKEDIEPTDEGWLDKAYAAGRNFADTATLGGYKYARAGADYAVKNAMNQLGLDDEGTTYQKELDQEVEKLNKDWEQEPAASLAGMGGALAIPVAGEYGAAVKGAQGLAGQALDTYSKAVKMYPLAKAALGFKDMKNPKVEDVELEENLLSRIAGLVGAYYGAQMGIPDAIMSTMDMPLGTYELTQHILGGVAGYALGATMGDVAIGSLKALTKRMLRGALNKAIQSIKGGTPQDQAWKNYEAEVKAQYEKIKAAAEQGNKKEPKLFDKTTTEGKIKGVDGKACWPGKRYAGKEKKADGTYKDICVPVKKGK